MAEPQSQLEALFEKLDKAISSGQHEKAAKAADNGERRAEAAARVPDARVRLAARVPDAHAAPPAVAIPTWLLLPCPPAQSSRSRPATRTRCSASWWR
jgi:hypothetical protein